MSAQNMTQTNGESKKIKKKTLIKIGIFIPLCVIVIVVTLVGVLTREKELNKSESTSGNQGTMTSTPSNELPSTPNSTSQNPLDTTPSSTFSVPTSQNPIEITSSLSSQRTSTPSPSMMILYLRAKNTAFYNFPKQAHARTASRPTQTTCPIQITTLAFAPHNIT